MGCGRERGRDGGRKWCNLLPAASLGPRVLLHKTDDVETARPLLLLRCSLLFVCGPPAPMPLVPPGFVWPSCCVHAAPPCNNGAVCEAPVGEEQLGVSPPALGRPAGRHLARTALLPGCSAFHLNRHD